MTTPSQWRAVVGACATLAAAYALGQTEGAKVTQYLRIVDDNLVAKGGPVLRLRGVEIDSLLRLQWDEEGLLSHMAELVGPVAKGRGAELGPTGETFTRAARLLAQAQLSEIRFRLATLAKWDVDATTKGQVQVQALQDLQAFRANAIADLTGSKGPGAFDRRDLAASLAGKAEEGFASLREVCLDTAEAARAKAEAMVSGAPRVNLYLSAHLITPMGRPTQIHLEGYDTLEAGEAKPFARYRLVLDDRTREELLAAQQLLQALRQFRETDLVRTAKECQTAVSAAIKGISKRLHVQELDRECDNLVSRLRQMEGDVAPILSDVRALQAVLRPLSQHELLSAPTQAEGLLLFAQLLLDLSGNLWRFVQSAPRLIESISGSLTVYAKQTPGVISDDALAFFKEMQDEFKANFNSISAEAQQVTETINATSRALLLTEDFTIVAEDLVAKTMGAGDPLDTDLDMKTIPGFRRPGDRVRLRAQVKRLTPGSATKGSEPESEILLEEDSVTLFVEAFGGYWQTGGALLFVDPRSRLQRSLSYEPTVGLGMHFHYGIRGNNLWNRVVNPGVGLTLSMLDFDDDQRFEVGAALGLTLFNDQVWLGYGRSLSQGHEYFYLGFNPYSLTRLLRGGR